MLFLTSESTVNKLRKRCAPFWRFRAKNPGCMGEQYFCIRYADTKIRPAGLSAAIPQPLRGLRDFRCNPGCMGEQRFAKQIATSPWRPTG
jgi:hypothetical protein